MDTVNRMPCKGDRVQVPGFLGVFEVIEVRENGSCADLKHLSLPCWDYTEEDMLSKKLTYLDPPQSVTPANAFAPQSVDGSERASALGVRDWSRSSFRRQPQTAEKPVFDALSLAS
jgi:hypothetical protein